MTIGGILLINHGSLIGVDIHKPQFGMVKKHFWTDDGATIAFEEIQFQYIGILLETESIHNWSLVLSTCYPMSRVYGLYTL